MEFIVTREKSTVRLWSSQAQPKLSDDWLGLFWNDSKYTSIEIPATDFRRMFGFTPKPDSKIKLSFDNVRVSECNT